MVFVKRTEKEMAELAGTLQNAVTALCKKKPFGIVTNKNFKILRVVWMKNYEKEEWYNGIGMKILMQAFSDKHGINVKEVTVDECGGSTIYLVKEK
ncbi:MAG: hypothetical protein ACOX2F_09490 [bacterium]